jgi:hypothetical protein
MDSLAHARRRPHETIHDRLLKREGSIPTINTADRLRPQRLPRLAEHSPISDGGVLKTPLPPAKAG